MNKPDKGTTIEKERRKSPVFLWPLKPIAAALQKFHQGALGVLDARKAKPETIFPEQPIVSPEVDLSAMADEEVRKSPVPITFAQKNGRPVKLNIVKGHPQDIRAHMELVARSICEEMSRTHSMEEVLRLVQHELLVRIDEVGAGSMLIGKRGITITVAIREGFENRYSFVKDDLQKLERFHWASELITRPLGDTIGYSHSNGRVQVAIEWQVGKDIGQTLRGVEGGFRRLLKDVFTRVSERLLYRIEEIQRDLERAFNDPRTGLPSQTAYDFFKSDLTASGESYREYHLVPSEENPAVRDLGRHGKEAILKKLADEIRGLGRWRTFCLGDRLAFFRKTDEEESQLADIIEALNAKELYVNIFLNEAK